jgi:hypothetical protein
MSDHPLTDSDLVLLELRKAKGEWVQDLYAKTSVMVHSRIAELRQRGHVIECRCFGRGDYRYRLLKPTPEQLAWCRWPEDPEHYDEREWR